MTILNNCASISPRDFSSHPKHHRLTRIPDRTRVSLSNKTVTMISMWFFSPSQNILFIVWKNSPKVGFSPTYPLRVSIRITKPSKVRPHLQHCFAEQNYQSWQTRKVMKKIINYWIFKQSWMTPKLKISVQGVPQTMLTYNANVSFRQKSAT